MTSKYIVQQVRGSEAEAIAVRFWSATLPIATSAIEKYRWFYAGNPCPGTTAFVLTGTDPAQTGIVGWSGVGVRRFRIRGTSTEAAVWVDLSIDQKHRTVMPAMLLVRAMRQYSQGRFAFSYGYPNRGAAAVCMREGVKALGKSTRYVRIVDAGWYLAKRGLPAWLATALATAPSLMDRLRLRWRRDRNYRFEWTSTIDSQLDALWLRGQDQYPILAERSAKLLNWRFAQQPGETARFALLRDRVTGEVVAYAVVQLVQAVLHVRDVFAQTTGLTGVLLDRLVDSARREGAYSISMKFLGNSRLVSEIEARGFIAREAERTVVVDSGLTGAEQGDLLANIENWYLTDFDEDQ